MESYIDNLLNIEDGDGIELEYDHQEYETFFPKYIERFQKVSEIKFITPAYNTNYKIIYYYYSTSLQLHLYDDQDYVKHVINTIKLSNKQFLLIKTSLQPIIPTNNNGKIETISGNSYGHLILIIYDKIKNQFYIIDPSGSAYNFKYYKIAMKKFFNNPIEIEEAILLQHLESQALNFKNEIRGYCVAWTYLYVILFILSETKDIVNIANIILKKCNNDPTKLRKLIRNFTFECA